MRFGLGGNATKVISATTERDGSREYVLYIGNFLDESIVRERGLPTHNVAGSNRMIRVASALAAANYRPIILSPASSLRMRRHGSLYNKSRARRLGPVLVAYAPSLNPGLFNLMLAPFFVLIALWKLNKSRRLKALVIYNYSPLLVLAASVSRLFMGVKILNNVEDIAIPRWRDWLPKTEARPIQQIVFYICMSWIAALSHGLVLPTRRFEKYLPSGKPILVAPGCIEVAPLDICAQVSGEAHLKVLFAGKIEFEHGVDTFINAMRMLDREKIARIESIDITGGGIMADWVREELKTFTFLPIRYHGFVSASAYRKLLLQADLCIAMQRADGRYGDLKTPSKVYEYLGFGKAVISSSVGDLQDLPSDIIKICGSNDAAALSADIRRFAETPADARAMGLRAYEYAKNNFAFDVVGRCLRQMVDRIELAGMDERRHRT